MTELKGRAGAYLLGTLLLIAAASLLGGLPAQLATGLVVAVGSVAATVHGIRRHRPTPPTGWWLIAAGLTTHVVGALSWALPGAAENAGSFGVPHALHAIGYGLLGFGTLVLLGVRRWRDDPAEWLDALVITVAVGVLAWGMLLRPLVDAAGLDAEAGAVLAVYPILALATFGCAMQLWVASTANRSTSIRLLVLGLLFLVAANGVQVVELARGRGWSTDVVSALRMSFFALLGAAALVPSMAETRSAPMAAGGAPWWRFASLTALAGLAPLGVVLSDIARGRETDFRGLLAGTTILFVLVVVRLALLGRALDRASTRDRVLADAGTRFVRVTTLHEARESAREAARTLLRDDEAQVWFVTDSGLCSQRQRSEAGRDARDIRVLRQPHPVHDYFQVVDEDLRMVVVPLDTHASGATEIVIATTCDPTSGDGLALIQLSDGLAHALDRIAYAGQEVERHSEERIQRLLHDAFDVVAVLDDDLTVRYITQAVARMLGVGPRTLVGHDWIDLVHPQDRRQARRTVRSAMPGRTTRTETRLLDEAGNERYVEMTVSRISEQDGGGYTVSCHDITRRFELEQQLKHQAFHDGLTGLANRALLQDRLRHAVERGRRTSLEFAVMFIDLDDFKNVNDSLGHAIGDALLRTVARRIRATVRPQDTAARLGGDEFAVLVEDVADHADVEAIAERLVHALAEPVRIGGAEMLVAASIGVAYGSGRTKDVEDVMRNADLALYESKGTGKGRYTIFRDEMHENAVGKLLLTADMRRGIARNEFDVHFQPLVDLRTGAILGVEALARWNHPTKGLLAPAHFVSVAEETGLVVPLGREILEAAVTAAGEWQHLSPDPLLVAVNVSARQLLDSCIVDDVRFALQIGGVPPESLLLEITESVLLPGEGVSVDTLRELADLGVRLYIDDFGTGYSSLSYLRQLPVRGIKLAREFVATLPGSAAESGLVLTIRSLAETLQLDEVVAEGIETQEQRDELVRLGFTVGQGYLLARPRSAAEMGALLRESAAAHQSIPAGSL